MNKQLLLCSSNAVMILAYLLSDTLLLSILLLQIAAQCNTETIPAVKKFVVSALRIFYSTVIYIGYISKISDIFDIFDFFEKTPIFSIPDYQKIKGFGNFLGHPLSLGLEHRSVVGYYVATSSCHSLVYFVIELSSRKCVITKSPADAVKPARRKSMQKLLQFDVFHFISPNSISPNFKV